VKNDSLFLGEGVPVRRSRSQERRTLLARLTSRTRRDEHIRAHPEDASAPAYLPQVIFSDSISLDMSSLERSGMRCPDVKAISVPLKSLSL